MAQDIDFIKELRKNGCKTIINNGALDLKLSIEFFKWLSYNPKFIRIRKRYLYSLSISHATIQELNEIRLYMEQDKYLDLIKKYVFNNELCTDDEYVKAYTYMQSHSIMDLIEQKLTPDELLSGKRKINKLKKNCTKQELKVYIDGFNLKNNPNNYLKLNMIDSYILHEISNIYLNVCVRELEEDIAINIDQNKQLSKNKKY